jgi:hypothetical protein
VDSEGGDRVGVMQGSSRSTARELGHESFFVAYMYMERRGGSCDGGSYVASDNMMILSANVLSLAIIKLCR